MDNFVQAGVSPRGTIPGLDGIRAVSILLVMLSHSGLQNIVPGVFGVTVFFFISGFLITTLLINEYRAEGTVGIGSFYLRRVLRLYPPLLVYLAAILVLLIVRGEDIHLLGLFGALFYFGNYLYALAPESLGPYGAHLWSLAVEEHFYLLFPLTFLFFFRRPAVLIALLLVLCVVALGIRFYDVWHISPPNETYVLVATEARFDSILFGCITALLVSQAYAKRIMTLLTHPAVVGMALVLIVFSLAYREPVFRQTWRFTIQGLALMSLVLAAIFTPRYAAMKRVLNTWLFRWIGALSYSLYLWHFTFFEWSKSLLKGVPPVAGYALGWVLSFVVALLVYRLIEQPIFRLRRKLGSHVRSMEAAVPEPDHKPQDLPRSVAQQ